MALEVCPTSNVSLGVYPDLGRVPLRALVSAGATVALGADDPLLFGPRLVEQYRSAREDHGFDDEGLAGLAKASISASRAPAALERGCCTRRWTTGSARFLQRRLPGTSRGVIDSMS